ncbi:unnamed protein product [Prorocentrum cordatum]|uniref:Protein disulfide-isomerase n=1 Tax=Prorocentrum cordatum TaxID=2364126 RepID=A0ABN9UTM7_9DINO|nr:unnamed protein product [Polarella glacialis]
MGKRPRLCRVPAAGCRVLPDHQVFPIGQGTWRRIRGRAVGGRHTGLPAVPGVGSEGRRRRGRSSGRRCPWGRCRTTRGGVLCKGLPALPRPRTSVEGRQAAVARGEWRRRRRCHMVAEGVFRERLGAGQGLQEQMDVDEGMQGIALARGSGSEQECEKAGVEGFPTIKFYNGASEDEFLDDRTASKLVDRFRGLPRQSGGQPLDGGGGAQDRGGRCPWRLPSGCAGRGPRGVGSTPGSGELGGEAPRLGRRRWIPPLGGTRAPQLQGHPGVLPVSPRASGSLARGPRGGPSDNGRRRRRTCNASCDRVARWADLLGGLVIGASARAAIAPSPASLSPSVA